MSFENYFWAKRIDTYMKRVLPNYTTRKRKFVNRCFKVEWNEMGMVLNLNRCRIEEYLDRHHDLLEKLWKLEFGTSIHS